MSSEPVAYAATFRLVGTLLWWIGIVMSVVMLLFFVLTAGLGIILALLSISSGANSLFYFGWPLLIVVGALLRRYGSTSKSKPMQERRSRRNEIDL